MNKYSNVTQIRILTLLFYLQAKLAILYFVVCLIESLYAASLDHSDGVDDVKPEVTESAESTNTSESGPVNILEIFKKFQSTLDVTKIFAEFMNRNKKDKTK